MRVVVAAAIGLFLGCSNTSARPSPPKDPPTLATSTSAASAPAETLVVLELFTSEGCSSCPAAEAVLHDVGDDPRVLPLAFHVDYWNGSWTDRFSSPAITARQQGYANALGGGLYTPELVVNGGAHLVGGNAGAVKARLEDALARPLRAKLAFDATRSGGDWSIAWRTTPPLPGAKVVAALVERRRTVTPSAGENAGATLHHDHVVRAFTTASSDSTTVSLTQPADFARDDAEVVVFVQEAPQGRVLAAARKKL